MSTPILVSGHTYSIQVQVKDATQSHVYSTDKRAWVHINDPTVGPPTLTAEPDADTATPVTLAWSAPTTTDGDALTYQLGLQITDASSNAYPEVVFGPLSTLGYYLGLLAVGTYVWRVRATDEHGMVGSWCATDSFAITQAGNLPVCLPVPWGPALSPVTSQWSFTDADGDSQTAFQVQLATDAGFTSIVSDSGVTVSTALSYAHGALAAGTYHRRTKVRTRTADWSPWATDTIIVTAATSQSLDLEIFRKHSDGILSKLWNPVTGVKLTKRPDGSSSLGFTFDQFPVPVIIRGLFAAHMMDEVSGTVAHDIVGAADLALTGTPAWTNAVLNLAGSQYGQSAAVSGLTLDAEFAAFLAVYPSGTTGTLWFLGSYTDDAKYYAVEYHGSGKVRIKAAGSTSSDLTVATNAWQMLRLVRSGANLKLKRMDTATEVTLATPHPTGTPRLAIGRYAGLTPATIVDAGKVATALLYTVATTDAENTQNYRALKEGMLVHRGAIVT